MDSQCQSDIFNFAKRQELSNSKLLLLKEFLINNFSIYRRGKNLHRNEHKMLVLNPSFGLETSTYLLF